MKTIIEFKDGTTRTEPRTYPVFTVDESKVFCADAANEVMTEDIELEVVARVIFEP